MSGARRIVCYAVNGSGLGHVTRLIAFARWMRRYAAFAQGAPAEVYFLTTSDATEALAREGFPAFKLPSKSSVRAGGGDVMEYRRLAKHFVWNALDTLRPDLLVVDTFPAGSFDELFQVLDGPFRKVFVHRDVKPDFAARPTFQAALRLYDRIIVPHRALPADPTPLPAGVPVATTGEVLQFEPADLLPRAAARRALGIRDADTLVYASAGGGGDPTAEATLSAIARALSERPDTHLLIGAGPLYRGQRLGGPHLTFATESGLAALFPALDAAITSAGYNTFHELLLLGVPTTFYAQDKVADDQAARVAAATAAGACLSMPAPDAATDPALIRAALDATLARAAALSAAARRFMPDNGARRAAVHALSALCDPADLARAHAAITPALARRLESQPDAGAAAFCDVLPRLCPAPAPTSAALDALLPRLSAAAADEVRAALALTTPDDAPGRVATALLELLDAAAAVDLPDDRVLAAIPVALRKHPLAQEPEPSLAATTLAVIAALRDIIASSIEGLTAADRLALYRVAPSLSDASASASAAHLLELLRAAAARGQSPFDIQRRLQALKLGAKRVRAADLTAVTAQLLEARP
jgi:UDP-N-acetylglucosamine--N-acetylmuramyl-(pentapeptide) pyrophosphoryl-undecaprenol N-acetylglucosamine transferase